MQLVGINLFVICVYKYKYHHYQTRENRDKYKNYKYRTKHINNISPHSYITYIIELDFKFMV